MEAVYVIDDYVGSTVTNYKFVKDVKKEQIANRLSPSDAEMQTFKKRVETIVRSAGLDEKTDLDIVRYGDVSYSIRAISTIAKDINALGVSVVLHDERGNWPIIKSVVVPYDDPADWAGIERGIKEEVEKMKKSKTASNDEPQVFEDSGDYEKLWTVRHQILKRNISNRLILNNAERKAECDRVEAIVRSITPQARVFATYELGKEMGFATQIEFKFDVGLLVEYEASADKIKTAVKSCIERAIKTKGVKTARIARALVLTTKQP